MRKVNNGTEYSTAGHYDIIDFKGEERTFQSGITLIR